MMSEWYGGSWMEAAGLFDGFRRYHRHDRLHRRRRHHPRRCRQFNNIGIIHRISIFIYLLLIFTVTMKLSKRHDGQIRFSGIHLRFPVGPEVVEGFSLLCPHDPFAQRRTTSISSRLLLLRGPPRHGKQQQQQQQRQWEDLDRYLLLHSTTSDSTDQQDPRRHRHDHDHHQQQQQPHVIVVGKIIIDEYGNPDDDDVVVVDDDGDDDNPSATTTTTTTSTSSITGGEIQSKNITVGGGGPQAALGAALALATLQYHRREEDHEGNGDDGRDEQDAQHNRTLPPPKQPVTLMAAVGELDFGDDEVNALMDDLGGVLEGIDSCTSPIPGVVLLKGQGCVTPKIRLWHEGLDQILKWYAVDDSFGDIGAGKLWKTVPSTEDYTELIMYCTPEQSTTSCTVKPILHVICEAGPKAPGNNGDSLPLMNEHIRQSISCLAVEPILFPGDDGQVGTSDSIHCSNLLQSILDGQRMSSVEQEDPVPVIINPDKATFDAMARNHCMPTKQISEATSSASSSSTFFLDSIAVREGPNGSTVNQPTGRVGTDGPESISFASTHIPAATLRSLVNPTGLVFCCIYDSSWVRL